MTLPFCHLLFETVCNVLECSGLFFQAQEKLGPVDMLVNCAGTSLSGKFEELEVSSFEVSGRYLFTWSQDDISSILK